VDVLTPGKKTRIERLAIKFETTLNELADASGRGPTELLDASRRTVLTCPAQIEWLEEKRKEEYEPSEDADSEVAGYEHSWEEEES
jgi:hypothetical protein